MKKFAVLLLFVMISSASVFADEPVRLAIGDWEPYTSETDPKSKLLEEVVSEAFNLEGITVQYKYFPWKRSYVLTQDGEFAGTFPWAKRPERENDFYYHTIPVIIDEGVYFHLKTTPFEWETIEDLKKYKVGVTIGYQEEVVYKEKGITADPVSSEDQNFKKMLVGRIDVYQTSKIVGYTLINKLFRPEEAKLFTNHPKPAIINPYYILFSKKIPNGQALADKFDVGLKKLQESGRYDEIIAEYLGGK